MESEARNVAEKELFQKAQAVHAKCDEGAEYLEGALNRRKSHIERARLEAERKKDEALRRAAETLTEAAKATLGEVVWVDMFRRIPTAVVASAAIRSRAKGVPAYDERFAIEEDRLDREFTIILFERVAAIAAADLAFEREVRKVFFDEHGVGER